MKSLTEFLSDSHLTPFKDTLRSRMMIVVEFHSEACDIIQWILLQNEHPERIF